MDLQDSGIAGLHHFLWSAGATTFRHIVDVAGLNFLNTDVVAALIGLKSARPARMILNGWIKKLTKEDNKLLRMYWEGEELPNERDPFPDLGLLPKFDCCSGSLLDVKQKKTLDLYAVNGKKIYGCCVKVLNKDKRNGKLDTVWRGRLGVPDTVRPTWRVFYKLPLNKRSGDLQWRILHGAIAVNTFVSKINHTVSNACLFCGMVETIFHCFLDCKRLADLFSVLERLFASFNEVWSETACLYFWGRIQKNKCNEMAAPEFNCW